MQVLGAARTAVRAAALSSVMIVVNCSGPQPETRQYGATKDNDFGVAHAATVPDASQSSKAPVMPENPSHISLRPPKAPEVLVTLSSGKAYPYPYTVVEEDDCMVVTLYLPLGVAIKLDVSPLDTEGKVVGDPICIEIEPNAKLGTTELKLDGSDPPIHFSPGAQQTLQWGDTLLTGPVTNEFVCGAMHKVKHGVLPVEEDTLCVVRWEGCTTVFSFLDEEPVERTEPFVVSLRKGQTFGVYPKLDEGADAVRVSLQNSATCIPPEE